MVFKYCLFLEWIDYNSQESTWIASNVLLT